MGTAPKILITGVTGMTGSHLCDYLLSLPNPPELHGTIRWRSKSVSLFPFPKALHLHECDLTDYENVLQVVETVRPDFVFHLAAQSYVAASWVNPEATLINNTRMQLNLFNAIKRAQLIPHCRVLVSLSSEEYGMVKPDELPVTEETPLRPINPYGVSKVTQDMMAYQYFQNYGLQVIRTRAFNHTGPRRGDVFATSNFSRQIVEAEAGVREPVIYTGDLSSVRDWTDVRDIVRAYWLAMEKCEPGELYLIASGQACSVQDILEMLLRHARISFKIEASSSRFRPSNVPILVGDGTRFHKQTGWQPTIPLETTMLDILNYWRRHFELSQHAKTVYEIPETSLLEY